MATNAQSFGPVRLRHTDPGPYQTNCYLLESSGRSWIVDAGFESDGPNGIVALCDDSGLEPDALILTHAHIDHIAGVAAVRQRFPSLPVWIHEAEADWLNDPELNLSVFSGMPVTAPGPDRTLTHSDVLTLGETSWDIRHVPGHSPGSIALVCHEHEVAIVGDALFKGSVGRTDFPNCSMDTLAESIRTQLYTLPDPVVCFPGHGPPTTIGDEKRTNPFVRAH